MFREGGSGQCPRCAIPLAGDWSPMREHLGCARCGGRFVGFSTLRRSHATLADLLGTAATAIPHAPLACPRCTDEMRALALDAITVDFCARHGVWFDSEELEQLLARRSLILR
jgi:Zn-finger nucleic acid-binding protein